MSFHLDFEWMQGEKDLDDFEVVSKRNLRFLYFDANHFTEQGSKEFDEKMKTNYPFLFDIESLKKKYSVKK